MRSNYIIIKKNNLETLSYVVNLMIDKGYVPAGGVSYNSETETAVQAMVKKE